MGGRDVGQSVTESLGFVGGWTQAGALVLPLTHSVTEGELPYLSLRFLV